VIKIVKIEEIVRLIEKYADEAYKEGLKEGKLYYKDKEVKS